MQSRLLFFIESQKLQLLVLSLASGFRLLLALHAGLLIVFSLAKLGEDAGTSHCSLKAAKCAVQGLAFFHSNFCHFLFSLPPLLPETMKSNNIIHDFLSLVKPFLKVSKFYFTTMLTILLGTTISLTTVLPSIADATFSSAFAMASTSSLGRSTAIEIFPLALPLI